MTGFHGSAKFCRAMVNVSAPDAVNHTGNGLIWYIMNILIVKINNRSTIMQLILYLSNINQLPIQKLLYGCHTLSEMYNFITL